MAAEWGSLGLTVGTTALLRATQLDPAGIWGKRRIRDSCVKDLSAMLSAVRPDADLEEQLSALLGLELQGLLAARVSELSVHFANRSACLEMRRAGERDPLCAELSVVAFALQDPPLGGARRVTLLATDSAEGAVASSIVRRVLLAAEPACGLSIVDIRIVEDPPTVRRSQGEHSWATCWPRFKDVLEEINEKGSDLPVRLDITGGYKGWSFIFGYAASWLKYQVSYLHENSLEPVVWLPEDFVEIVQSGCALAEEVQISPDDIVP